jgi:hypothetical protein
MKDAAIVGNDRSRLACTYCALQFVGAAFCAGKEIQRGKKIVSRLLQFLLTKRRALDEKVGLYLCADWLLSED